MEPSERKTAQDFRDLASGTGARPDPLIEPELKSRAASEPRATEIIASPVLAAESTDSQSSDRSFDVSSARASNSIATTEIYLRPAVIALGAARELVLIATSHSGV